MGRGKNLTEQELLYIKVNSTIKSVGEIAKDLNRNYWTIYKYMEYLGNTGKTHTYTPEDDKIIKRMYKQYKTGDIAKILKVDKWSIYNRVRKLGLEKKRNEKNTEL